MRILYVRVPLAVWLIAAAPAVCASAERQVGRLTVEQGLSQGGLLDRNNGQGGYFESRSDLFCSGGLESQASNSDGVWNQDGASVSMQIISPLWANRWAYAFYALLAAGAVYLVHLQRARAHRRELSAQRVELERGRVAAEALWRAEEALRKSQEQFKQFMDNFPGVGFIKDIESRPVYVNKAFEQLFGVTQDECVGKRNEDLWPPAMAAAFRADDLRLIEQRRPIECLDCVPTSAGPRFFRTTKFPILDEHGGVALICGVAIEITEQKKTEEVLRLQTAALRSAANAIVITTPDGRVTWANPAFTRLTGYAEAEVIGRTMSFLKSGLQTDEFYAGLWKTCLAGQVWRNELVNRRKDGSTYIEEQTITPVFDDHDQITNFIAIKQDVTEKKRFEEQLLQAQKMESIGTLAGGIAHDFNNLLGIIVGYTTAIMSGELPPEEMSRCMQAIEQAAGRGAGLVKQILTFARKSEASLGPVDLNATIFEVVALLRQTLPRTVEIATDLQAVVPAISADYSQVHQAVLNLSLNACDAMPNGGTLRFSTSALAAGVLKRTISAAEDQAYVCLSVSDSGLGMDDYTRSRAFEPFFTTKEAGRGTGLGLAVVYGIIQLHRGFVELESAPSRGATFRLYWPAAVELPQPATPSSATLPQAADRPATILVVEDEELLRVLLVETLKQRGYDVLQACDGLEAVALYGEHHSTIDLVVMDHGLPKLDGARAFERLKQIDPSVRVILASGRLDAEIRQSLLDAGLLAFLQKPFSIARMLQTVREKLS